MKESNANENLSWKKTQLHRFSVENLSLAKQFRFYILLTETVQRQNVQRACRTESTLFLQCVVLL